MTIMFGTATFVRWIKPASALYRISPPWPGSGGRASHEHMVVTRASENPPHSRRAGRWLFFYYRAASTGRRYAVGSATGSADDFAGALATYGYEVDPIQEAARAEIFAEREISRLAGEMQDVLGRLSKKKRRRRE